MRYNTHFRNCETVSRLASSLVNSFIRKLVSAGQNRTISTHRQG